MKVNRLLLGFTLVEVLMVIGVIGILGGVLLPSYRNFVSRGRDQQRLADVSTIQQALEQYYIDNSIYPPSSNFIISSSTSLTKGTRTYLTKIPKDPSSSNPQYSYTAQPVGCDNGTGGQCSSYCLYIKLEQDTYVTDLASCANDLSYNLEVSAK